MLKINIRIHPQICYYDVYAFFDRLKSTLVKLFLGYAYPPDSNPGSILELKDEDEAANNDEYGRVPKPPLKGLC